MSQRIGPLELIEVLGQGASGIVYRALHHQRGIEVAVKLLHDRAGPKQQELFQREARALGAIAHPSVVRLLESGATPGGQPYLVMELLRGESLAERLRRLGPLPAAEVQRIGVEIAAGLQASHDAGLVHRDVKPSNILLVDEPAAAARAVLCDFGVARPQDSGSTDTRAAGTPAYLAPEVVLGGYPDARSDIYGLGVSLYEALSGQLPHETRDPQAAAMRHAFAVPRPLEQLAPAAPPALVGAIQWAMAHASAERPRTAAALAPVLAGKAPAPRVSPFRPPTLARGSAPPAPPRRRWLAAGAAAVVLGLGAGVVALMPRDGVIIRATIAGEPFEGAQVFIDGRPVGPAPHVARDLVVGRSYSIRVEAGGEWARRRGARDFVMSRWDDGEHLDIEISGGPVKARRTSPVWWGLGLALLAGSIYGARRFLLRGRSPGALAPDGAQAAPAFQAYLARQGALRGPRPTAERPGDPIPPEATLRGRSRWPRPGGRMRIAAAGAALLGGSLWLLWPVTGRVDSTGAAREPQAMALPASDPAPVSGAPETESSPAAPPSPIPRTAAPVSAVPGPGIGQPGRYPPPAKPPARPPPGELKLPEPRRSSDAFLSWLARRLGLGLLYLGFSGWLFRYLLEPRQ